LRAWSHCRAALLGRYGALGDLQFVANRVLAAAIYLVMLWPIVRLISRLERRIAA
jgi:ABC-type amino acid transport system permease subunit